MSTQTSIGDNDGRIQSDVTTASTGPFAIDFPFNSLDDVIVQVQDEDNLLTTLVRGVDYTITATVNGDGTYPSGTVTLTTAIENSTITRYRSTALERNSQLPLLGHLDRTAVNADLNRVMMAMQDFRRNNTNSISVPEADGTLITTAIIAALRANKILAWDSSGNLDVSTITLGDVEAAVLAGATPGTDNIVGTIASGEGLTSRPDVLIVQGKLAADDGGGGVFIWVLGSTDTVDGATCFSPTGVPAGRYKRMRGGSLFFSEWFGIAYAGSNDIAVNTTAIEDAIAAIAALGGGTLVLSGLAHTNGGHVILNHGICIRGSDPYKCGLVAQHVSSDILTIGSDTVQPLFCHIGNIGFTSGVTRSGGAYLRFRQSNACTLSDFYMNGSYYGIEFNAAYQTVVYNGLIAAPVATTGQGIRFHGNRDALPGSVRGSDVILKDIRMSGTPGAQPQAGVYMKDFTGFWFSNVGATAMGIGLYVAPAAGDVVEHGFTERCAWDSGTFHGILLQPGGGTIRRWTSVSTWASTNGQNGLVVAGTGDIADMSFVRPTFINNGSYGAIIDKGSLTTLTAWQIILPFVAGNSSVLGTYDGIYLGNTDAFTILGGKSGPANGLTDRHRYNLYLNGTNTNLNVDGLNVTGGVTGTIGGAATPSSTYKIHNCTGFTNRNSGVETGITTDGSGDVTITHGLSSTPRGVKVNTVAGLYAYIINPHTFGATTFKVRCYDLTTGVLASTAIDNIAWEAFF